MAKPLPNGQTRIYGAENIRRHLQRQKRDWTDAPGSLAPFHHEHKRANARRVRQAERDRANRTRRAEASDVFGPFQVAEGFGLSRRRRWLPL